MLRFAHMSDCHLGSWNNHPELREMSVLAFERALGECVKDGIDFVLISGDLFDTALPPVDILRRAVAALRKCKEAGMRVYAIAGSHDFSPTGKTMLHVLEDAGLLIYACSFSEEDGKIIIEPIIDATGALICGFIGKKGALDVEYFPKLSVNLGGADGRNGYKIFMFHSAIAEYRPKNMEDMPAVSLQHLPAGFDYYASGHVHVTHTSNHGSGIVAFPCCLFPTEFTELEKNDGGYFLVSFDGKTSIERKQMKLFDVVLMNFSADGKSAEQLSDEIGKKIDAAELSGKALLLKAAGTLASGKPADVDVNRLAGKAMQKGAFTVKRNMHVSAKEFEEFAVAGATQEEIERKIISEHEKQLSLEKHETWQLVLGMMKALEQEKGEDETAGSYESRVVGAAKKVLELE